jgi:hypothetical protein
VERTAKRHESLPQYCPYLPAEKKQKAYPYSERQIRKEVFPVQIKGCKERFFFHASDEKKYG